MDRHDVTAGGVNGLLGILIECIQGQIRNRCRINNGSYNPIGETSGQNSPFQLPTAAQETCQTSKHVWLSMTFPIDV
jgi:hypothetical protein